MYLFLTLLMMFQSYEPSKMPRECNCIGMSREPAAPIFQEHELLIKECTSWAFIKKVTPAHSQRGEVMLTIAGGIGLFFIGFLRYWILAGIKPGLSWLLLYPPHGL
jgi:hypothetical protein